MSFDQGTSRVDLDLGGAVGFGLTALKWFVVINIAIGWILLWGNLARIHLTMGDVRSAVVTIALFIGPIVVAILWWAVRRAAAITS
jgi:hypothetical protein